MKKGRRSRYEPLVEPYLLRVKDVAEQLDCSECKVYRSDNLMPFELDFIGVRILAPRFLQILNGENGDSKIWQYNGPDEVKPKVLAKLASCSYKTIAKMIKEGVIRSWEHAGVGRLCSVNSFFSFINENKRPNWK